MREASNHLIIPAEKADLEAYLQKCRRERVRVNINHIGEAILGEAEAHRQLAVYLNDLKNPAIEYVSIKISTIYSQLQPLAFEHSVSVLSRRLAELYRTAGIKWNVQPESTTHRLEFFGPLLGVMHARDLNHAIELVNQTGYGLTSGLESLDQREHVQWAKRVRAGNLYINRGTSPIFHENDARLIESIAKIGRIRYAAPARVPPAVFISPGHRC